MTHQNASTQELTSVVSRARTMAAQNELPVGTRELFLALLAGDPRGVIHAWQDRELNGPRLIEAVKEWWPAADARGALPAGNQLTAEAGAALEWTAEKAGSRAATDVLLNHLLDTCVLQPASTVATVSGEISDDPTALVLSAMGLV